MDILQYLIEVAPIVVIMGFGLKVIWSEYKEQVSLRFTENKENFDLLVQVSSALERVVVEGKQNKQVIIQQNAEQVKEAIDKGQEHHTEVLELLETINSKLEQEKDERAN